MRVTTESERLPLRERKRLSTMKRVQRVAVEAFLADGFDAVSVERVADSAEVSPMSVYRWFGSKEGLVIWDEFDPPILDAVAARLDGRPPLTAVRDGLVDLLSEVYTRERELVLDRTRLIVREPALRAAATANGRLMREALAGVLAARAELTPAAADVVAAAAVALLDVAVERWERDEGRTPLATVLGDVFDALDAERGDATNEGTSS